MARKLVRAFGATAVLAAVLAGCASTDKADDDKSGDATKSGDDAAVVITVGTTDKVFSLDPAGSYDNGSFAVMNQIYPFLLNTAIGAEDMTPQPDIATSAEFTAPTQYTVKLKEGLTFANGNKLTSSDVKFSFDRMVSIADANGPSSLLGSLESVEAPDDLTVVFNLKAPNDQTFPGVLTSPVGPIIDEEVFPADSVLADADIAKSGAFAGQYSIDTYRPGELISFKPFDGYNGMLGKAQNTGASVKYYADATNMKLDIERGNIDVAYRSLSATDTESLRSKDNVQVIEGPGGEIRYMVFNFDTNPYGAKTADADPAKAVAVRQAIADVIDRAAIAKDVYKDTYTPLYSYIPAGVPDAVETFKTSYGDKKGGPDVAAAKARLEAAGVTVPVELKLQYNPDHYGPSSGDEYAAYKSQLEASGLFKVDLQSTEWVQYNKDRVSDVYPIHQLGWFPDYSDPDNYITPFFMTGNFVANHYENAEVDKLIKEQVATPDAAERADKLKKIQELVTEEISTLPLLQGKQFAYAGKDVKGVALDASFKLRIASVSK